MADYPGLPNWGYGLHIDPNVILQLFKGTPQGRAVRAETGLRTAQAGEAGARQKQIEQMTPEELNHLRAQSAQLGELTSRIKTMTPAELAQMQAGTAHTQQQTKASEQLTPAQRAELEAQAGHLTQQTQEGQALQPGKVTQQGAELGKTQAEQKYLEAQPGIHKAEILQRQYGETLPMVETGHDAKGHPTYGANPQRAQLEQAIAQLVGVQLPGGMTPKGRSPEELKAIELLNQHLGGMGGGGSGQAPAMGAPAAPTATPTPTNMLAPGYSEGIRQQNVQALKQLWDTVAGRIGSDYHKIFGGGHDAQSGGAATNMYPVPATSTRGAPGDAGPSNTPSFQGDLGFMRDAYGPQGVTRGATAPGLSALIQNWVPASRRPKKPGDIVSPTLQGSGGGY